MRVAVYFALEPVRYQEMSQSQGQSDRGIARRITG